MTMPAIPRRLGHIWIGDRPAPTQWMGTWRSAHPDWSYTLFDNDYLTGRRWRNQALINEYFKRRHFEGVSDLMRYEILFEQGGFLPEADSTCLRPCDEIFTEPCTYSCYETHPKGRMKMTPFLASAPGTEILALTLDEIHAAYADAPETAQQPWIAVGNLFLRGLVEKYRSQIKDLRVLPAYSFVPQHKDQPRYDGPGRVYADHHWGTTRDRYDRHPADVAARIYEQVLDALGAVTPLPLGFDPEEDGATC